MSSLDRTLETMRGLIGSGQNAEAEVIGRAVYSDYSSSVALNKGIAVALNFQGKLQEAYNFFDKAYRYAPKDTDLIYNLATLSLNMGMLHRAEFFFTLLLDQGVKSPEVYKNFINVLIRRGDNENARSYAEKAFEIFPGNMGIGVTYIAILETSNKLVEAKEVLATLPESDLTKLMAARLDRRGKDYEDALKHIFACKKNDFDIRTQAEYHYEYGLIQDKCGDYNDAFSHFGASNEAARLFQDFENANPERFIQDLQNLKITYSTPAVLQKYQQNPARRAPAFFVGFPRSGTTLMEQMLKAHSQIVTTDERSPFEYLFIELCKTASLNEIYENWQNESLEPHRQRFWQIVDDFGLEYTSNSLLVDKLPLNIIYVPFIRLLFPDAPVLVAYRDPRDVCLSAFMQRFKNNDAMANFLDLDQTAKTYDLVMSVWEEAKVNLQGEYFSYKYENLIDDFQNTIEQVIDYLDLPFEGAIHSYRELAQERHIKTPSYREVLNPLNRDALDRWKNYEQQIKGIMSYLNKWVCHYDYAELN